MAENYFLIIEDDRPRVSILGTNIAFIGYDLEREIDTIISTTWRVLNVEEKGSIRNVYLTVSNTPTNEEESKKLQKFFEKSLCNLLVAKDLFRRQRFSFKFNRFYVKITYFSYRKCSPNKWRKQ